MPATITPPSASYPRPTLVHDHKQLFVEPIYEGGLVYADPADDEEDDGDE